MRPEALEGVEDPQCEKFKLINCTCKGWWYMLETTQDWDHFDPSHGLQPSSDYLQPNSNGLQPTSKLYSTFLPLYFFFVSISDDLQPRSDRRTASGEDSKFREWGWRTFMAFEKDCHVWNESENVFVKLLILWTCCAEARRFYDIPKVNETQAKFRCHFGQAFHSGYAVCFMVFWRA